MLLPVHNRREVTRRFIECLVRQEYADYHLILLDDGSTDDTAAMVRAMIPSATVLRGDGTWWWAGALQKGYEWIESHDTPAQDYVLIANDDTVFGPEFLQTAIEVLEGTQKVLLLAQCLDSRTGAVVDAGVHIDWRRLLVVPPGPDSPLNCLSTRGLFLRAGDFIRIGGFHPRLLPHYLSDYEFTARAGRMGYSLACDKSLRLSLDVSQTGFRAVDAADLPQALRRYFSVKSALNPLAWTAFVFLACPPRWMALGLVRVWARALLNLGGMLRRSVAKVLAAGGAGAGP